MFSKPAAALMAAAAALLVTSGRLSAAPAAPIDAATASLVIDPCSAAVRLGFSAQLKVEPLNRQAGTYVGAYLISVRPVGFGSEKGAISVEISDESIRKVIKGGSAKFRGKATNAAGQDRAIEGEAKSATADQGTLHLRITSERGVLNFNTRYHLQPGGATGAGH